MIKASTKGDFNSLEQFLKMSSKKKPRRSLDRMGSRIVKALADATPKDSAKTAKSWRYEIKDTPQGVTLEILNSNLNKGVSVARLIHFGHGTGTGGYVPPRPFIDKAIDSVYKSTISKVFDEILKNY